jgi:hypothetical protein
MRSLYAELMICNSALVTEHVKRAGNHAALLGALKEVNLMIQRAAQLRGAAGRPPFCAAEPLVPVVLRNSHRPVYFYTLLSFFLPHIRYHRFSHQFVHFFSDLIRLLVRMLIHWYGLARKTLAMSDCGF